MYSADPGMIVTSAAATGVPRGTKALRPWAPPACVVGLVLGLVGCSAERPAEMPSGSPDPTRPTSASTTPHASNARDLLRRPLALPKAVGETCPVTQRRPLPPTDEVVLGNSPVAPVANFFGDDVTMELRPEDRDEDGSYWGKTPWVTAGYEGPVLIRAARIDDRGQARVRFQWAGRTVGAGTVVDITGPLMVLPGDTRVQGPGCYAYQVDGLSFSEVIVFRTKLQSEPA